MHLSKRDFGGNIIMIKIGLEEQPRWFLFMGWEVGETILSCLFDLHNRCYLFAP
jgi:hypothetical protein